MMITLKGTPPSLNKFAGRLNTWDYRSEKEHWTAAVYIAAQNEMRRSGARKKPPELARVEISYYFPDRKRRDPDNYAGKFLLDGLTKAGAIMDDDFRHIQLSVEGHCDKDRPRTIIKVTEIRR